jgi:hypothetical protein
MITTITPLRRAAVTLVLAGATAFGAVAIAPAAFADDSAAVVEQAPVTDVAPDVAPEVAAPEVVVPDAPVVETPAPVAEAPAPAPVIPPEVVIGKDGKPVKAPKVCTDKDQKEFADRLAKANKQAEPLLKAAAQLRQGAAALRAQLPKLTVSQGRLAQALATVGDMAASKLEAQAQALITKAGGIGCITVTAPGGRF